MGPGTGVSYLKINLPPIIKTQYLLVNGILAEGAEAGSQITFIPKFDRS